MWYLSPLLLAFAANSAFAEGCPPGTREVGRKNDGLDNVEVTCMKFPQREILSSVPENRDYHTAVAPLLREARKEPALYSFKIPRTDQTKIERTPTDERVYRMMRDASAVPVPLHDSAPFSLIVDLADTTGKVMRQAPQELLGVFGKGFQALSIIEIKDAMDKKQHAEAGGAATVLVVGIVNPPLGVGAAIGGYLSKNAVLGLYTFQAMNHAGLKPEHASKAAVTEYNRSCEEDPSWKFLCGITGRALP